jgi:hypothetical protein
VLVRVARAEPGRREVAEHGADNRVAHGGEAILAA